MKKKYLAFIVSGMLLLAAQKSAAQNLNPIIEKVGDKISAIEKNERTVEKTVYDYIHTGNSSRYNYEYQLYRSIPYTYTVLADATRSKDITVKLYKSSGDDWELVKQSYLGGTSVSLRVVPTSSALYKVEISTTYLGSYTQTVFGLIIDREQ